MIIQHTNFGSFTIIRCGHHEGVYDFGAHIHQFCELVWVQGGEIEMTVEGKTETAREGDITVITPFQIHSFHTPEYCKIWICVFSNDFLSGLVPVDDLCHGRSNAVFTPSHSLLSFLREISFEQLCMDFYATMTAENANGAHQLYMNSVFHLIVSEYFVATKATESEKKDNTLQRILMYMMDHFREEITQVTVGKALGYSPRYISNCFEAIPNMNFRTMLNSLRIEYAKNLLITTDESIIEIALKSGFSGERSFHRAFLSIVGMTPGQYRKSKRI